MNIDDHTLLGLSVTSTNPVIEQLANDLIKLRADLARVERERTDALATIEWVRAVCESAAAQSCSEREQRLCHEEWSYGVDMTVERIRDAIEGK